METEKGNKYDWDEGIETSNSSIYLIIMIIKLILISGCMSTKEGD